MLRFGIILLFLFLFDLGDGQEPESTAKLKDLNSQQLHQYFSALRDSLSPDAYELQLKRVLGQTESSGHALIKILACYYLGDVYVKKSDFVQSDNYYKRAIKLATATHNEILTGQLYMTRGGLMNDLNKKDEALKSFLEAFIIFKKTDSVEAANAQYRLANLQYSVEDYNEAIKHAHIAKAIYNHLKYDRLPDEAKKNFMSLLNTLGIAYNRLKNYDSAIYYINEAHKLALLQKNKFWQGLTDGNLGKIYLDKQEYDTAIGLLLKDLKISREFKVWSSAAMAAISLGHTYIHSGDLRKAKQYYDSARYILDTKENLLTVEADYLKSIAEWNHIKGDYKQAYQYHIKYMHLKDSLDEIKYKLNLSKAQLSHEFDSKVAEIELLTKDNELQENAIERSKIIITASTLLIILIVAIVFYMNRNLKIRKQAHRQLQEKQDQISAQNEELTVQSELLSERNKTIQSINQNLEMEVEKRTRKLKQVNTELDTFLYKASHDIRQPIATILGLENLAQKAPHSQEMAIILDKLNITACGMDLMLSKLQMIYQLNHEESVRKTVELKATIDKILWLYKDSIKKKNVVIENNVTLTTILTNPNIFVIIIRNIIENAINFSQGDNQPVIKLSTTFHKSNLALIIEDNGCGIQSQYLDQIFTAYFKGSQLSKGNGLGLYISKKAAELLGIDITVESTPDKGTVFSIFIPKLSISHEDVQHIPD